MHYLARKNLDGLFECGAFSIGKKNAKGLRIYKARFVDRVKQERTPHTFKKSSLVVQGFNDKQCFLTHAPTIQRASQRLLLSLAIRNNSLKVIFCDTPQVYVQFETTI